MAPPKERPRHYATCRPPLRAGSLPTKLERRRRVTTGSRLLAKRTARPRTRSDKVTKMGQSPTRPPRGTEDLATREAIGTIPGAGYRLYVCAPERVSTFEIPPAGSLVLG